MVEFTKINTGNTLETLECLALETGPDSIKIKQVLEFVIKLSSKQAYLLSHVQGLHLNHKRNVQVTWVNPKVISVHPGITVLKSVSLYSLSCPDTLST